MTQIEKMKNRHRKKRIKQKKIDHVKLLRRKKFMSISYHEHRKQKNEMTLTFSKHKYSKLLLFYENTKN